MKKPVLLGLLILLLAVLPVTGQADELAGTWIGFFGPDFRIMRFSQDGENLSFIDTMGEFYSEYNGPFKAEDHSIFFAFIDGQSEEMTYSVENGKLFLDWNGEWVLTRIDDSFFPNDPEASPYIGENRQYMIELADDGGIRIYDHFGDVETVEIPSAVFGIPVTEIGEYAVSQEQEMKHLILPDGIKKIAANAFSDDIGLEDVRLPKTLESIAYGAFQYCYNMEEVVIPEGVKVIEDSAFWECNRLRRIVLPESLEETYPESFYGADRLRFFVKAGSYAEQFCKENEFRYSAFDGEIWEKICRDGKIPAEALPDTADRNLVGTWIDFYDGDFVIFRFSPNGSDLTILESHGFYPYVFSGLWEADGETIAFTQIEDDYVYDYTDEIPYHFDDGKLVIDWSMGHVCTRIDDSYFPEDPYNSPFLGEDKLWWISRLEDGTIQIDGYLGNEESLTVPDNVFGFPVTSIRETAFMSQEGLKHVIIPHGVTFIGRQAFSNDYDLESVELPDTLETLEYCAFEYCRKLEEIVIPEGVTFLDTETFYGCEGLKRVVLPESFAEVGEFGPFDPGTVKSIHFVVTEGSFAEDYCRDLGLNCFTADGTQLTGGDVRDGDPSDEPYGEGSDGYAYGYEESYGDEEMYNKAMELYNEEKYFSARQAFLMSGYPGADEWAEKCIQDWPATGEIWHDRSQWLQDMELTIIVEQPEDTGMLIRIYKDNAPVSYLFLAGSDSVTVRLPGNGYYEIRDGVGYNWYGSKEAFGSDGVYETMTFDENGTERVYLQSYYAYTLSINISVTERKGDDVYTKSLDYSSFVEE